MFLGESIELIEKKHTPFLCYYRHWSERLARHTDPCFPLSLNYSHWEKWLISPSSLEAPRMLLSRFTLSFLTGLHILNFYLCWYSLIYEITKIWEKILQRLNLKHFIVPFLSMTFQCISSVPQVESENLSAISLCFCRECAENILAQMVLSLKLLLSVLYLQSLPITGTKYTTLRVRSCSCPTP